MDFSVCIQPFHCNPCDYCLSDIQVQFLEDRLAAAQAYMELPPNMRPLLLEDLASNKTNLIEESILNPVDSAIKALSGNTTNFEYFNYQFDNSCW